MSEILLNAILNLFALVAVSGGGGGVETLRSSVKIYLRDHLRLDAPDEYLALFEAFWAAAQDMDEAERKATAWSVCGNLLEKLPRQEQLVALMNVLSILASSGQGADTEQRLGEIVASALDLTWEQYDSLATLVLRPDDFSALGERFLVLDDGTLPRETACRRFKKPGFLARWTLLKEDETGSLFLVPTDGTLSVGGLPAELGRFHLLRPGDILHDDAGGTIYHSELRAALDGTAGEPEVIFEGQNVDFRFPGSDNGLHDFNFRESSGRLVGVMGGSGTGKSTLLSILNGTRKPDSGSLTINGHDLYAETDALDGVIGYVPQDDLLFDDLTVFDNLYFNARLCLSNLDDTTLRERVDRVLAELGQLETRDLKVGSPLDKTISGGQRKRLNIALELIREPAILFADEPTSGLSSADSSTVINLLKEQAAKGKLVIVVIHQPSSEIFKQFDTLWVLDKGGRPVFSGNPLESLAYFRGAAYLAGGSGVGCPTCGSVRPEQLFEILEARELDAHGHVTNKRLRSPQWWHERHLRHQAESVSDGESSGDSQPSHKKALHRPGLFGQLGVFLQRNALARLANRQYVLVNLLEAPLIALLLAWLTRYAPGTEYSFAENRNVPLYFFMATVVALFMGLSVSAEEIVRDRRILKRERFLNLSWFAYVNSKALYLAGLVGAQTLIFTLIGGEILAIPDMTLKTWGVLFSCGLCAAMLGLNVSAAFRSAVAIYILVPLLLIPQMLLAGSVISFDELMSADAQDNNVPWFGNVMPSRWGYEALLVEQYSGNRYMAPVFADDCAVRQADYMLDFHLQEMRSLGDSVLLGRNAKDWAEKADRNLRVLRNELPALEQRVGASSGLEEGVLSADRYDRRANKALRAFLSDVAKALREERTQAHNRRRAVEKARSEALGHSGLDALEKRYANKGVRQAVLKTLGIEPYVVSGGRIVQLASPVCKPANSPYGGAHFAAGAKRLRTFGVVTYAFNLAVIWLMIALLLLSLYLRLPEFVYSSGK